MSSSDSESLIPTINEGLSIPELMKIMRQTFLRREFKEVEDILVKRDQNMKMEMENLARDLESIEKEARLLERTLGLAELEKLKLEEKLQRSEEKLECLDSKLVKMGEEIEDLRSEKLAANQTLEELRRKLMEAGQNMRCDKLAAEKTIEELRRKLMEADQDMRRDKLAANQTIEELRRRLMEADRVVEELKRQNFEVTQTVDPKDMEADQVVGKVKRQNFELTQTVDELRLRKKESDEAAEHYKSRLKSLEPRIMKVEAELANIFKVNVDNLPNLAAAAEGDNVVFRDISMSGKDSSANSSSNRDAENVAVMSPGVRSTSNSIGSGGIGLLKKGGRNLFHSSTKQDCRNTVQTSPGSQPGCCPPHVKSDGTAQDNEGENPQVSGGKNLDQSWTKEDGASTVRASPGSQSGCSPCVESDGAAEDNVGEEPQVSAGRNSIHSWTKEDGAKTVRTSPGSQSGCGPRIESDGVAKDDVGGEPQRSGPHACVVCLDDGLPGERNLMLGTRRSSKMACSSSAAGDVIQISDSDDERNLGDTTNISDTSTGQTKKRNRTDRRGDSPVNLVTKRKRRIFISDEKDNLPIDDVENPPPSGSRSLPKRCEESSGAALDRQSPLQKSNVLHDVDSADSDDESCSDAFMDNLVATLRSKKFSRT